ncbi:MAG TPA: hypothetical protein VII61_09785 [Ktedonobacteraceae bacterium]
MSKKSISKAELLSTPDPVDCSWCASEQGAPTTDSPGICNYHDEMLQQQHATRQLAKHDIHAHHARGTVRSDETLADFVGRKLGWR